MSKRKDNKLTTYQVLHLSQIDLSQSAFYADSILLQQMHYEPWEISLEKYWHQLAYYTAMVISYCRPFSRGRGNPNFPVRLLKNLSKDEESLHTHILFLRKKIYAHTDLKVKNVRPVIHNGKPTAIEAHPQLCMTNNEIKAFRKLIQKISIAIQKELLQIARDNKEIFK